MCHPLCSLSQRFGKRQEGDTAVFPKRMLNRMGKRNEQASRVLGRISKRQEARVLGRMSKRQEEETSRMLTRMSKRQNEETTRILGRMTKRGKFANMRWRRRAEEEVEEALGEDRQAWEGPAGRIHLGKHVGGVLLGKHWLNLALNGDKGPPRPNAWGRVSKRANHEDGRRFSRIGMVKREAEDDKDAFDDIAKRSGASGRFIRIGLIGEEDNPEDLRIAKKRSETNDQSRWIRIGVNHDHQDWGRIAKKAKEWNPDVDKFDQSLPLDSDLLTEPGGMGGAGVDEDWEEEVGGEKGGGGSMISTLGGEGEVEGRPRRQWQRLTK